MTTKTAQFTPGPWFTTSEMRGIGGVKVYGVETRDRYPIANCGTGKLGMDNATLIAAAPVMYADLRIIRDYLYKLYDDGNMQAGEYAASLDTTLAQAEGR